MVYRAILGCYNTAMSKERALLINPEPPSLRKPDSVEPLGLEYLAAQLEREGIATAIHDGSVVPISRDNLRGFSFIGVHAKTLQYPQALKILRLCQAISAISDPKIHTCIGGPHITAITQQFPKGEASNPAGVFEKDGWGTFCSFEADLVIGKIVKENIPGFVQGSRVQDLDGLPFPARHLVKPLKYAKEGYPPSASILFSRGCPFACSYCDKSQGKTIRFRSPENVVEEIQQVIKTWGIRRVLFYDDTLTLDKKRSMQLFERLSPLKINWECNSRVNTIDEEMLQAMKRAGCDKIKYGIESGDPTVLKAIDKKASVEQAAEAIRLTKAVGGINAAAYFLFGLPEDNWSSLENTLKFLNEVNPDSAQLAFAVPLPNTPLYEKIRRLGWPTPDNLEEYHYAGKEGPHTWLKRTSCLDEKEFSQAKQKIQEGFAKWAIEKHAGVFGVTNVVIK